MIRIGFVAFVIVCSLGCGTEVKPAVPKYSFRLLGSAASIPGKPVVRPGGDLATALVGKKHEAAHVWVECRLNGAPMPNSRGADGMMGRIRYPDGRIDDVSVTTDDSSVARVVIPSGYGQKPPFASLEIYAAGKVVGAFRIETLGEPLRAISSTEPRMKNPRWQITQKSDGRLYMDIKNHAKDTVSIVALKRTTYLDLSEGRSFPETLFLHRTGAVESLYRRPLPPQNEVELQESEYRLVPERLRIDLPNLEIENVYNTPVITVPAPITVKTESGFTIKIPKQRIPPFRQGQKVRHDAQLRIKVDHDSADGDAGYGGRIEASYSVEGLSEGLGKYGIWELILLAGGSASTPDRSLKFPNGSATIRAGKLPKISLDLGLKSFRRIANYEGIVPVENQKKPSAMRSRRAF